MSSYYMKAIEDSIVSSLNDMMVEIRDVKRDYRTLKLQFEQHENKAHLDAVQTNSRIGLLEDGFAALMRHFGLELATTPGYEVRSKK